MMSILGAVLVYRRRNRTTVMRTTLHKKALSEKSLDKQTSIVITGARTATLQAEGFTHSRTPSAVSSRQGSPLNSRRPSPMVTRAVRDGSQRINSEVVASIVATG